MDQPAQRHGDRIETITFARPGIWKGPIVFAIMAVAVLLWWLPMREARKRSRP